MLILVAGFGLAIAGCGDSDPPSEPAQRAVPAAVAQELAKKSDEVAAAVDSGDECDAAHKADELLAKIEERSNDMPATVRQQARAVANDLTAALACEPPPKEPKEKKKPKEFDEISEEGGVGPGRGKGHYKEEKLPGGED
jgi:hypothetical protein